MSPRLPEEESRRRQALNRMFAEKRALEKMLAQTSEVRQKAIEFDSSLLDQILAPEALPQRSQATIVAAETSLPNTSTAGTGLRGDPAPPSLVEAVRLASKSRLDVEVTWSDGHRITGRIKQLRTDPHELERARSAGFYMSGIDGYSVSVSRREEHSLLSRINDEGDPVFGYKELDSIRVTEIRLATRGPDDELRPDQVLWSTGLQQKAAEHLQAAKDMVLRQEARKIGECVIAVVQGNTYEHRHEIKRAGGRFDKEQKVWHIFGVPGDPDDCQRARDLRRLKGIHVEFVSISPSPSAQ